MIIFSIEFIKAWKDFVTANISFEKFLEKSVTQVEEDIIVEIKARLDKMYQI